MNFGVKLGYHFAIIYISIFLSNEFPFAPILGFLSIILSYWIDKYLLLRRYSHSIYNSSQLCDYTSDLIDYIPFFYCLGLLFFNFLISKGKIIFHFDWIALVLSIIYLIILRSRVKINDVKYPIFKDVIFENVNNLFSQSYQQMNPINDSKVKTKDNQIDESVDKYIKDKLIMNTFYGKSPYQMKKKITLGNNNSDYYFIEKIKKYALKNNLMKIFYENWDMPNLNEFKKENKSLYNFFNQKDFSISVLN